MSDYVNGLQIHMNEVVLIDFIENSQHGASISASVSMTYETLRMMHGAIAHAIEQHGNRLAELSKARSAMN